MPRESTAAKKERTMKIIAAFRRTYPNAHCELTYANPLQLLVAVILSAQCTDKRVNIDHAGAVQKISHRKRFRGRAARGTGAVHQVRRIFPQQGEEHPELLPQTRRASRRRSAAHDGGIARARRRRAQDGERRSRQCVRRRSSASSWTRTSMRLSHRLGLVTERTP